MTKSALDSLYDALTKKAQTVNKGITREIVEDWVGEAGPIDKQIAFMSATLNDLGNGTYAAEELVDDMLQLTYLDN
ncbi:MAG: hypothetical protein M0Z60_00925 [Nitrospiraceae bacterium]|nr:hypothetical protein [Nitrospiraceae bacterium]